MSDGSPATDIRDSGKPGQLREFKVAKRPADADSHGESKPLNERVPRHHIYCDAPGCGRPNPPLACPHCDAAYFCGEECRAKDAADQHGHTCHCDRVLRDKYENGTYNLFSNDAETLRAAKNEECAICLAEEVVQPTVLTQCKHKFCAACLTTWSRTSASCPTCRMDMLTNEEHEEALTNLLSSREVTAKSLEERTEIRAAVQKRILDAIADRGRTIPLLISLARHEAKEGKVDQTKRIVAEIREKEGVSEYANKCPGYLEGILHAKREELEAEHLGEDAISAALEAHPATLALRMLPVLNIILGEAYRCDGDYHAAIKYFEAALAVQNNCATNHSTHWQLSECYYHAGMYQMCIESARKALSMGSRHRGLVHKCLYLSHIALGESLAAVQALEQGILKALDNGDRAELYGIFQEFTNRQPPFDPREADCPTPRFAEGDVVDCRVAADTWRRGTVHKVWWSSDEDEHWPSYYWVPYQIKLDGDEGLEAYIFSPVDCDEAIREPPRFVVGQKVQACVEGGWEDGAITELWPSFGDGPGPFEGVDCPYTITMEDGSEVYAPEDSDRSVRVRSD